MTSAQSLHRKFGAVELPLVSEGQADFTFLDPARDILLELFATAIGCELAPVWDDAVARSPLLQTKPPVAQKLPSLPSPEVMAQAKFEFPLLSVGRAERPARREDYTLDQDKLIWRWDVDYILGPLALQSELQVRDVLQFIVKVVTATVRQGGHRAYSADENGYPVQVFGDGEGCCGFYSLNLVEATVGAAGVSREAPKYHAATIVLESEEVSGFGEVGDPDAAPLLGATGTLGLAQSGDPALIAKA